jgi:hypothetical protein
VDCGDDQGYVVGKLTVAEFRNFLHHAALGVRGGSPGRPGRLNNALIAKFVGLKILRFGNAIGEEEQAIAGIELNRRVCVGPFGQNAEDAAVSAERFRGASGSQEKGGTMAGIFVGTTDEGVQLSADGGR